MAMALLLGILIDCALIHYQFETIRPFLDGKGRMGRLQITFYLCWKGVLHKTLTLHIQ
jgi:Fic family protein